MQTKNMKEQFKPTFLGESDEAAQVSEDRYERVPEELKIYPQWVNWRSDEQKKKVPVNPRTQGNAGVTFENTWAPFPVAVAVGDKFGLGIGFVLTERDPYTCIDLDKVISGRQLDPAARQILDLVGGYVELSPSGAGLHIWVKNREVINRRTKGIEIYSSERWMTVTGRANPEALRVIPERTHEISELIDRFFPTEARQFVRPAQEATANDQELWKRLFKGKNGAFVRALYDGDLSVVSNDHSRGVIMLANLLAVFTNGDEVRMEQMLTQTKLVNEKWYEKRGSVTWIEHQIRDAVRYVLEGRHR